MNLESTTSIGDRRETSTNDALHRYVIEHIDEAIEHGDICAYYQPVIRTLTGKLCGLEALARWEDPEYGLIMPEDFIGPLEDARLIHKLDCTVIRQICKQYRACVEANIPIVPVSFNLSRLDFDLCDIFSVVENAVHEFEVPRHMLNIEITETVFGTDPEYMAMMVRLFRDAGYQVWMDDFGSGYSTLNALKDFDFDELKIDMNFLDRFGDKSKTILASVVDMAKKLGIRTLAEGVETEEHRAYLRHIGCEKMQGFLYGRPHPFDMNLTFELQRTIGIESANERQYYGRIGTVNTLSLSERDFSVNNSTQDYVTSMSLAIVEYDGASFHILDCNHVFREGLESVGLPSVESAENVINNLSHPLARTSRKIMETIAERKYARQDVVIADTACVMLIRHITTQGNKTAVLISIDNTITQSERKRHDRLDETFGALLSIYEHIDIIHFEDETVEPVFSSAGFRPLYDVPDISEAVRQFAQREIFPPDRARYVAFMDPATMLDRIRESNENYIVGFFRTLEQSGNYTWKLFGLVLLTGHESNHVMICIRPTHWDNDALFQEAYDGHADGGWRNLQEPDMRVTDGSLWRAFIRDEKMGFFWKDRNRRFLGANQTFLDYYGFDSVNVILGKTDEDMNWHVDPVPFMEDELRVLNEGCCTHHVAGQCIVRGEIRDISATKRPIYRNGRIVGLVGYFVDTTEELELDDDPARATLTDHVTNTLNYTGLEISMAHYVDAFKRVKTDFGIINIDIESFKMMNDEFGYDFGDKALRRIADEIREVVGKNSVIGHVYADRFAILIQSVDDEMLKTTCENVEKQLMSITHIDGIACTVYTFSSFARYSEVENTEQLKKLGRERLEERKAREHGA